MDEIRLASASPRRKKLMSRLCRSFGIAPAHVDETIRKGESFAHACKRLARAKARAVAEKHPGAIIIGADTAAYLGKRNFRKTGNARAARSILLALSGKTHTVATGVCVVFPGGKEIAYCEKARVRMRKLDGKLLEWYMKTGEWKGRAGSYDVSDKGARLVAGVKGEKETVVGLPLRRLRLILRKK